MPWPRARRPARPWSSSWPPRASSSRPALALALGLGAGSADGSSANGHAPPACASPVRRPADSASRSASSPATALSVVRRRSAIARESGLPAGLVVRGGVHHGVDGLALGERRVAQAATAAARERGLLGLAQGVAGLEQRLDQLGLLARDLVGGPGRGGRLGQLGDDRGRLAVAGLADLLGGGVARRGELLEREPVERVDVSHRSRCSIGSVPDPPAARHRGGRERRRRCRSAPTAISPAVPRCSRPASARSHASASGRPGVAHQRVDLVRERDPDDRLAVAGAGDRGGGVVGPRAGGDQRRVADAAGVLAAAAAGGGRGGHASAGVARDGADGPAALVVAALEGLRGAPRSGTTPRARCRARPRGRRGRPTRRRASRAGPRRAPPRRGAPGCGCP